MTCAFLTERRSAVQRILSGKATKLYVAETFTITKKSVLCGQKRRTYPPFCAMAMQVLIMKTAQPIGTYPTAEMLTFLKRGYGR
jgi:hypothetical protein